MQNDQVNAVRRAGGYADLSGTYGVILIKGPQAAQFLQARVSNDVLALKSGQGELTALLERKGHIMAFFSLHRLEETFWIVAETEQIPLIYSELEKYHFREQVEYEIVSDRYAVFTVQGPLASKLLSPATDTFVSDNGISKSELYGIEEVVLIRRNLTGENGALIFARSDATIFGEMLRAAAQAAGLSQVNREVLNICRIEAGIPLFGTDMSEDELLPETGLEHIAASYTKGCFQGQEVLARIKTYGAPKRGLMGIEFAPGEQLQFENGTTGTINDTEETVIIRSNVFSPTLERTIALAYVSREFRVPNKELSVKTGDQAHRCTVVSLPFYTPASRSDDAKRLYEAGLAEFAGGSENEAISLLREAIDLNPTFADAYEALGVILSRHEQYDEAIALMQKLEALDPESIMAHANLSVFYMQQGNKELAEEEKAKAMSIRMSQAAREFANKQQQEKDKQEKRQEAEHRMGMFKQVLEIDPDDLLANHGMGSAFVELEDYASAVPFLRKALEIKPTHTVAYVALGKALEALGDRDAARKTYEDGIAVASKRGDITPMKEMQELMQNFALVLLVISLIWSLGLGSASVASAKNQPLQQQTPILDDGQLQGGTGSTQLQGGTGSTQLQGGTGSTQLQGGTGSTQLQGGTNSTQLQGEAKLNTLTIQDWQKMDLKGFTNQARLMPAIPATARFVAATAKLDDDILKAKTTRLDDGIDQNGERVRVMVHLVRCPPADPGMQAMWMAFEREMRFHGEDWQHWEEKLQESATSIWQKNAGGEGAISFHLVVDDGFNIVEISDQSDNKFASDELEKSARRTLELLRRSAGRFPSNGVTRVHIRVSFIRGPRT